MAHGDTREGEWRGNWRMEWVASALHTTSGRGVSSITTADAHTSAASSRLNWRPRRFKWTLPFRRKTKSGFCACAITFQTQSNTFIHNFDTFFFWSELIYLSSLGLQWNRQVHYFSTVYFKRTAKLGRDISLPVLVQRDFLIFLVNFLCLSIWMQFCKWTGLG